MEPWHVVVCSYKLLKHIDQSINVLISKVPVQVISECPMSTFHDCAFHVGVLANVKPNVFALQHVLKRSLQKFFPLSICTQRGRLLIGFEYFLSLRTDSNAEVTEGPVFDFRDTCRYFEKTSITLNKYFIPSIFY